jgi:hypothetical protein
MTYDPNEPRNVRNPYGPRANQSTWAWIGGIAAVIILALIVWAAVDNGDQVATDDRPATTTSPAGTTGAAPERPAAPAQRPSNPPANPPGGPAR